MHKLFFIHHIYGITLCFFMLITAFNPSTLYAQTDANGQTAETQYHYHSHLPITVHLLQPGPSKVGIHMGNRNSDWPDEVLAAIDPEQDGKTPEIVTIISEQLFEINRIHPDNGGDCSIELANISVKNQNVYDYLKMINTMHDTKVVIRIRPSPGNFEESISGYEEWVNPTELQVRTLNPQVGYRPGNWLLCDNAWRFRPVDDVGDEILFIQKYVLQDGWEIFGFEPANEPNAEWYGGIGKHKMPTDPSYTDPESWEALDDYFAALYDYVHGQVDDLALDENPPRIFTPPMAQNAQAEWMNVFNEHTNCNRSNFSGYEIMKQVFIPIPIWDPNWTPLKNDGYSWHNYWVEGLEQWGQCPNGQHVSYHFPGLMKFGIIWLRPSIITELDLVPLGFTNWNNSLTDKDANPVATANSINQFIKEEQDGLKSLTFRSRQRWYMMWLLNDNVPHEDTETPNENHSWAMAYDETKGGFRPWFDEWWK